MSETWNNSSLWSSPKKHGGLVISSCRLWLLQSCNRPTLFSYSSPRICWSEHFRAIHIKNTQIRFLIHRDGAEPCRAVSDLPPCVSLPQVTPAASSPPYPTLLNHSIKKCKCCEPFCPIKEPLGQGQKQGSFKYKCPSPRQGGFQLPAARIDPLPERGWRLVWQTHHRVHQDQMCHYIIKSYIPLFCCYSAII